MTLIHKPDESKGAMTDNTVKEDLGKSTRPVRNRRYTRLVPTNMGKHESLLSAFIEVLFVCHSCIMYIAWVTFI